MGRVAEQEATAPEADADAAASRARERILLAAAGVTLLFTLADTAALGRFSGLAFGVRLAWAGMLALAALALRQAAPRRERALIMAVAVASALFFAALAEITGGQRSPLFHWILAMPLTIAVVVQDHPRAVLGAGVTTVACGLGILWRGGSDGGTAATWAVQAAGLSALAVYASATYRRLRRHAAAAREASRAASARARASEAEIRARDEFLSVAAHELRTPLTSLLLHVEATERADAQAAAQEPARRRNEMVARQARRLQALVERMLDVTRLQRGRLPLSLEQVDLAEITRETAQRLALDAAAARCELKVDAPAPVTGTWDRERLEQVAANLIGNAVKYGAGGAIEVSVSSDGDVAWLRVRDHGMGIDPADQARIFERFERAAPVDNYGGLGLGLWITRRVVDELGGEVAVSSAPGQGATFTARLPRRAAVAARSAAV